MVQTPTQKTSWATTPRGKPLRQRAHVGHLGRVGVVVRSPVAERGEQHDEDDGNPGAERVDEVRPERGDEAGFTRLGMLPAKPDGEDGREPHDPDDGSGPPGFPVHEEIRQPTEGSEQTERGDREGDQDRGADERPGGGIGSRHRRGSSFRSNLRPVGNPAPAARNVNKDGILADFVPFPRRNLDASLPDPRGLCRSGGGPSLRRLRRRALRRGPSSARPSPRCPRTSSAAGPPPPPEKR